MSGGPSKTWIMGNSLVTITTSGKLTDDSTGVCLRCAANRVEPDTTDTGIDSTTSLDEMASAYSCWHGGWAEIKIRRPSGNTAWMMRLQNRPHPLSLTHPSLLGIPESELGLLAASLPPEEGVKVQVGGTEVTEGGRWKNEGEFIVSQEVGSYTDISFASNLPRVLSGGSEARKEQSNIVSESKEETKDGYTRTQSGTSGAEHTLEATADKAGLVVEAADAPGLLSIGEVATLVDNKASTTEQVQQTEADLAGEAGSSKHGDSQSASSYANPENSQATSSSTVQAASSSAIPGDLQPGILDSSSSQARRQVNSQSWSENVETAAVPITPRASSYSFSMEHLPPLLSYDGGEEFGQPPSLHEGGRVMSEEEQVRAGFFFFFFHVLQNVTSIDARTFCFHCIFVASHLISLPLFHSSQLCLYASMSDLQGDDKGNAYHVSMLDLKPIVFTFRALKW